MGLLTIFLQYFLPKEGKSKKTGPKLSNTESKSSSDRKIWST